MKTKTIEKINEEQAKADIKKLDIVVDFYDQVYKQLNGIGIHVKLVDIHSVIAWSKRGGYWQEIRDMLLQRFLDMPKNAHLKTATGSQKVSALPDFNPIVKWIDKQPFDFLTNQVNLEWLTADNGRIKAAKNSEKLIYESHTKRTVIPDYEAINKRSKGLTDRLKNLFKNPLTSN